MIVVIDGTEYGERHGYGAGGTEGSDYMDGWGENGAIVLELDETYVSDHTTRPIVIATTTSTTTTSTMSTTSKSSVKIIDKLLSLVCFFLYLYLK